MVLNANDPPRPPPPADGAGAPEVIDLCNSDDDDVICLGELRLDEVNNNVDPPIMPPPESAEAGMDFPEQEENEDIPDIWTPGAARARLVPSGAAGGAPGAAGGAPGTASGAVAAGAAGAAGSFRFDMRPFWVPIEIVMIIVNLLASPNARNQNRPLLPTTQYNIWRTVSKFYNRKIQEQFQSARDIFVFRRINRLSWPIEASNKGFIKNSLQTAVVGVPLTIKVLVGPTVDRDFTHGTLLLWVLDAIRSTVPRLTIRHLIIGFPEGEVTTRLPAAVEDDLRSFIIARVDTMRSLHLNLWVNSTFVRAIGSDRLEEFRLVVNIRDQDVQNFCRFQVVENSFPRAAALGNIEYDYPGRNKKPENLPRIAYF